MSVTEFCKAHRANRAPPGDISGESGPLIGPVAKQCRQDGTVGRVCPGRHGGQLLAGEWAATQGRGRSQETEDPFWVLLGVRTHSRVECDARHRRTAQRHAVHRACVLEASTRGVVSDSSFSGVCRWGF